MIAGLFSYHLFLWHLRLLFKKSKKVCRRKRHRLNFLAAQTQNISTDHSSDDRLISPIIHGRKHGCSRGEPQPPPDLGHSPSNHSFTKAFSGFPTSSGLALSLSSTIFTDTGLTTTITSGGLTRDNTLTLSGTVTVPEADEHHLPLVQIYDGATLLGTANFTAESFTNWAFVTPGLLGGGHSFTAKVTDDAGNTTTASAVTAIVDATSPNVTSVSSGSAEARPNPLQSVTLGDTFTSRINYSAIFANPRLLAQR